MILISSILITSLLALALATTIMLRRRGMHLWLPAYIRESASRRSPRTDEPVHLILCIADHFEPQHGGVSAEQASERVRRWTTEYPRLFGEFHDSDGKPPQQTFFYPLELYEAAHLDALADLCRSGYGEVEVQLHHENDTAIAMRQRLHEYKQLLHARHGLLTRGRGGEISFGFVHGNWALDNSHPKGKGCGVNGELELLHEAGCYADFTFPSAPDLTQPRKINRIYYAAGDPSRCKSHDDGVDVGTGPCPTSGLMLIQGPLLLDWGRRKWGLGPRIENGCLQGNQAPTERRLDLWLRARVQIRTRPDWFFVKLYAHGATEASQSVLLGEPMTRFHESLQRRADRNPHFHFHYVTAREMYNLARAAEQGWTGTIDQARNFELAAPEGHDRLPAGLCAAGLPREKNA